MNFRFSAEYVTGGSLKKTDSFENDDFSLSVKTDNEITSFALKIKNPVSFKSFLIEADYEFLPGCRIFTNGYQSWTISREYEKNGRMNEFNPKFLGVEKKRFNPLGIWGAGDLTFHKYPQENGIFYGYSYGYVRNGGSIRLLGSLSERSGYTVITYNTNTSSVKIEKDLEGVVISNDITVVELAQINGSYDDAFDRYFELMEIPKPRESRKCGYTTWYNYYTNVTEEIVSRDLEAISRLDIDIDIFQIDDGYERTVGDWLITDEKKFPGGMKQVCDDIHKNNMLAGLWLAPFAVTPKSYIYKSHKDWLVTDSKGKAHYASHNWGGFYALDIYNDEVRAHLKSVFNTVLNEWGYDMVKLDFLYACSIIPIHNKSRGEIMCDAMDFLRECCGEKIILGCGVPLAPAFGKVDFCRIGCDVALDWNKNPFSREDVSTKSTLTSTIFRRHLDGRAWLNDPDVILLRDNNIKMPLSQRKIIATVNRLLGNLLFVSDDVSTYTAQQREILTDTFKSGKANISMAEYIGDTAVRIDYTENGKSKSYSFDIESGEVLRQD